MNIDVVFDTVCPWCFLGKRRLENALSMRPGVAVEVRYHPFLLNPDMPDGGMDRRMYLEHKFAGPHRARRVLEAVGAAGESSGVRFDFDAIERMPNSIDSHRLLRLAAGHDRREQALETVFEAFFQRGQDIGRTAVLVNIGAAAGLDPDDVRALLADDEGRTEIRAANARAHAMGISGVPSFVFNGGHAIAGAQDAEVLVRLIDLAVETDVRQPVSSTM